MPSSTFNNLFLKENEIHNRFAIHVQEAIAVGRSFAALKGYQLDGNKEMMAMGFMNLAGSLSSCYVATGKQSSSTLLDLSVEFTAELGMKLQDHSLGRQ